MCWLILFFSISMADRVMMSGLRFAFLFSLHCLCMSVVQFVVCTKLYCVHVTDRERVCRLNVCIYECHRHTVLVKLSCFVHGGCISVIKSCLPVCADVLFNLFLLRWLLLISLTQSLLCKCLNIRDLFFACVELPCVNATDTETLLKLNLAVLCTACTLVSFRA